MTLFTSLIKAEATAKQINQEEQLNRRDYIGEIAEGKGKAYRERHVEERCNPSENRGEEDLFRQF